MPVLVGVLAGVLALLAHNVVDLQAEIRRYPWVGFRFQGSNIWGL
jgi:xanthine/uracil permease